MSTGILQKNDCCQSVEANGNQVNAAKSAVRRPKYNISESSEAFDVAVALPGVRRDGIEVNVVGDLLSVAAKSDYSAPEGWRPVRCEIPSGDFLLNLKLNAEINEQSIKASVNQGVLKLTLPKAEKVKLRKIKIS